MCIRDRSVHGKKEVLAAPLRIEHPHGHERVMDLAALDRCIALPRRAGLITRHSLFQRASQRTCTARIGALAAVLRRHIELVGKEARKIALYSRHSPLLSKGGMSTKNIMSKFGSGKSGAPHG